MTDLVGFLGYSGQTLRFLDQENVALVQGNALCVLEASRGPREMLLRMEGGISCFASHPQSGSVALASAFGGNTVEIVKYATQQLEMTVKVPTNARLVDMAFSRSGEKLFALSDTSESLVICWDLGSGEVLFSRPTEGSFSKIVVNPGNDSLLAIYGSKGIKVGVVSEIMGSHSVAFAAVTIEPEFRFGDEADLTPSERASAFSAANSISCALWTPYDILIATNLQGNILEVLFVDGVDSLQVVYMSSLKKLSNFIDVAVSGSVFATCMAIGSGALIVCTSVGAVVWYPCHSFTSKPDGQVIDSSTPLQTATIGNFISSLAVDPSYTRLIVGSTQGEIMKLPLEVQERPVQEQTEEEAFNPEFQTKVDDTPIVVNGEFLNTYQTGAIICSAALSIPNNKNKKLTPVYAVGTQSGSVSFWLQPFVESDRISENGGVRRAAPRIMTMMSKIDIITDGESPAVICSMAAVPFKTKRGGQMLCLGLDNGWFEVWEIMAQVSEDDDEDEVGTLIAKKIASRRFFTSALTTIVTAVIAGTTSQARYCVSVASSVDSLIYSIELFSTIDGCMFDVQSVVKLGDTVLPTSLVWTSTHLCVCCSDGRVVKYSLDAIQVSTLSADLIYPAPESSFVMFDQAPIQPSLASSDRLISAKIGSNILVSLSLGSGLSTILPSSHSGAIMCTANSTQFLATGCIDGSVYIWDVSNENKFALVNRTQLHSGAVLSLCFSSDGSLLLSTSVDGSYFICTVSKVKQVELQVMKLNEMGSSDQLFFAPRDSDSRTWMEQRKVTLLQGLKQIHDSNFLNVTSAISEISQRLETLLKENVERSELEKMERSEFVVDIFGQEAITKENQKRADVVRLSYFQLNAFNELIAARVRQNCWDSMSAQSRYLLPILEQQSENLTLFVSSMPIRKCSDDEALLLERVKRLRAIEMRCQQKDTGVASKLPGGKSRCSWSTTVQGCPETVSWLAFDGVRWPAADVIEMIVEREKAEAEAGKAAKTENLEEEAEPSLVEDEDSNILDAERDIDDNDVFNLLYPPQSVRTQVQKRFQITLLREIGRLVRAKFNAHFDRLVREKEDVMASVESRNVRIRVILDELKQQEDFLEPKWNDKEIAGAAISVRDDEVVSRPYESEAQRAARLREEEERRRREAEKDANDIKGRALDEMMHGTLEIKRDAFADASSLQRPAWMDEIPLTDMTEAQLKEVDAFEVKLKALQEEQAKYRKTLEVELKKLKAESVEVCKVFDEKLQAMVKLKVFVQREILSQELYMSRVSQSMAQRDQAWQMLKKNEMLIESTRSERRDLRAQIDSFNVEVEKVRGKLNTAQEDEKNMEKSFKRDVQTLCNVTFDQDQLKVLTQLYRLRVYPDGEDEADEEAEESEVLGGNAASKGGDSRSSKGKSSSKKSSSKAASGVKKGKAKASKGGASASGADPLGPMQEAAKALDGGELVQSIEQWDPFYAALRQQDRIKKAAAASIPLLVPLDMESDCPEAFEIDQFQWSKLQELRNARIEKEIESMLLSQEYIELKQKLERLCGQEAVLLSCLKDLLIVKDETQARLVQLENDLIVIVGVKQGQDEVDREAVVTDYSSAAFVPVEVARKFNDRIKEHGKEKIGVLNRIKTFRRKINILEWEAQHLNLESNHYEEYYTDLQLLRVTRELQHVIREGSNAEQAKVRRFFRLPLA